MDHQEDREGLDASNRARTSRFLPSPFYLVTDDAAEACLALFARDPECRPKFVTLVTDVVALDAMPSRTRAFAYWSRPAGVLSQMWQESRGRFVVDGWKILDEISAWKHAQRLTAGDADAAPGSDASTTTRPMTPVPTSRTTGQSRWYS